MSELVKHIKLFFDNSHINGGYNDSGDFLYFPERDRGICLKDNALMDPDSDCLKVLREMKPIGKHGTTCVITPELGSEGTISQEEISDLLNQLEQIKILKEKVRDFIDKCNHDDD